MEYIDVLTEDGKPTGQSVLRSEVHAKGLWHRAVHIWIINSKEELLIQKRSAIKESSPGKWDISAAGHMSAGESILEAVHKEISEELGIEISSNDLIDIGVVKKSDILKEGTYINNQFDHIFLVKRDLNITKLVLQESEVEEVKLIPWQELKKRFEENDPTLVRHEEEFKLLFKFLEKK